jgi:predicted DCC family thiol-disulfide oxidoreductase YuxK
MALAIPLGKDTRVVLHPDQLLVIYDGTCGFCSRVADNVAGLDWRRKVVWLPSQTPGLGPLVGLTSAETDAAAWAVTPTGAHRRGAGAAVAALDALLPGGIPAFATLYRIPGLHQIANLAYDWVARNRGRFAGTAVCQLGPPAPLDDTVRWELERRMAREEAFGADDAGSGGW